MNSEEAGKRIEKVEEEIDTLRSSMRKELQDGLVRYELASASERQERDRNIVMWRDMIHNALMETPSPNFGLIHEVMDAMDDFLNRAGGRRK